MKTVVVLIEKLFVCPVAISIPDWWDDAIARQRIGTPESLGLLEDMADPSEWEEANDMPEIRAVGAPGGAVEPALVFGSDEPMPPNPDQEALPL